MEGLERLWAYQRHRGPGLYAGAARRGLVLTPPQQTMLILGPPRSGKSTTLVVPNILAAPGSVIATSTKPELMEATAAARLAGGGRCWLFDPSGTTPAPPGVTRVRWSPVAASGTWDGALLAARALSGAARPGGRHGDHAHWVERAEALVAPLLHAAAVSGRGMADVQRWVLRHDLQAPSEIVAGRGIRPAADVLTGLANTEARELSGIWSTAAGLLAAYRSQAAVAAAEGTNLDPAALARTGDTVYICAPGREQELLAPITVAFVEAAVAGAYQANRGPGPGTLPLTLILDEVANIAPLPSLPGLVAEGAGQGVLTVACLQDLAQARQRWGTMAEGFGSLFGTKVALPGIGDLRTLELISQLGGEVEVATRSVSRGAWWSRQRAPHTTWSPRRQRRLPVDAVHHQPPGTALMIAGPCPPTQVRLMPWHHVAPFHAAQWARLEPAPTPPTVGEAAPPVGEAAPPVGEAAPPLGEAAPPLGGAARRPEAPDHPPPGHAPGHAPGPAPAPPAAHATAEPEWGPPAPGAEPAPAPEPTGPPPPPPARLRPVHQAEVADHGAAPW